MPTSDDWTDADFVPREPSPAAAPGSSDPDPRDFLAWLHREICWRLRMGEAQTQIVAWLGTQGYDHKDSIQLIIWAKAAPAPASEGGGGPVMVSVEEHYESGEVYVYTDPVASARVRAAARKQRAKGQPDAPPAQEYEFAQPGDAARARLGHQAATGRAWVWWAVGALLAAAAAVSLAAALS